MEKSGNIMNDFCYPINKFTENIKAISRDAYNKEDIMIIKLTDGTFIQHEKYEETEDDSGIILDECTIDGTKYTDVYIPWVSVLWHAIHKKEG